MVNRYRKLTNSKEEFRRIIRTLRLRFLGSSMKLFFPPPRGARLKDATPSLWLPMRHHPGITRISGLLAQWSELSALYSAVFKTPIRIRVAWRNGAAPLHLRLRGFERNGNG